MITEAEVQSHREMESNLPFPTSASLACCAEGPPSYISHWSAGYLQISVELAFLGQEMGQSLHTRQ